MPLSAFLTSLTFPRVCLSQLAANLLMVGNKVSLYLCQDHLLKCRIVTNVPGGGGDNAFLFF